MDFFNDILPIIVSLAAVVGVLYLSYVGSKYLAKRMSKAADSSNIRVVERATLGQDKGIAIVEVCASYYLISYTNTNIQILKDLPDYVEQTEQKDPNAPKSFQDAFLENLKAKFGSHTGDQNDKK